MRKDLVRLQLTKRGLSALASSRNASGQKLKETTSLEKLKQGAPFTWGEIVEIHVIGNYTIVEYHPWQTQRDKVLSGNVDLEETAYCPYVNGEDLHQSFSTLDWALAACISYAYEGLNQRGFLYFMHAMERIQEQRQEEK